MAINFPTSLDVFTDPSASDQLNLPSHSGQHTDLNNAVEALEAKVGADSSAVTSSHDYKIAQLEARTEGALVFISRTTVGSAVSSVTVSAAFSSTYDSYQIVVSNIDASVGSTGLNIQFGAITTGYYGSARVDSSDGTTTIDRRNPGSNALIGMLATVDNTNTMINVQNPNLAKQTVFHGTFHTGGNSGWFGGQENATNQHTTFTLIPTSGTLTGGTIDVYGYAKA